MSTYNLRKALMTSCCPFNRLVARLFPLPRDLFFKSPLTVPALTCYEFWPLHGGVFICFPPPRPKLKTPLDALHSSDPCAYLWCKDLPLAFVQVCPGHGSMRWVMSFTCSNSCFCPTCSSKATWREGRRLAKKAADEEKEEEVRTGQWNTPASALHLTSKEGSSENMHDLWPRASAPGQG